MEAFFLAKKKRITFFPPLKNLLDETQWFSLVAWSKLALYVEKYLTKGTEVAVDGRLVNKMFTDKNGVKRTSTEIIVNEILLLSKQKELLVEM